MSRGRASLTGGPVPGQGDLFADAGIDIERRCDERYCRGKGHVHAGQHSYACPDHGLVTAAVLVIRREGSGREWESVPVCRQPGCGDSVATSAATGLPRLWCERMGGYIPCRKDARGLGPYPGRYQWRCSCGHNGLTPYHHRAERAWQDHVDAVTVEQMTKKPRGKKGAATEPVEHAWMEPEVLSPIDTGSHCPGCEPTPGYDYLTDTVSVRLNRWE